MRQALVPHTASAMNQRRRSNGFTLIEVMIVVAIVAILAAVAIPSYRDYILRGQLVDGTTILSTVRADMERYYQDNRKYIAVGGFVPPCASIDPTTRTQGKFVVTCTTTDVPQQTFLLTATATSGSALNFAYSVDQRDNRSTVSTGITGWPVPVPNTCWVMKRGQVC
jgi:prepilin-type N-terminal cleavage/methylation domain-containing protein